MSSRLADQSGNSYRPENLVDGNPQTAWCEGVRGPGLGESVMVYVDHGSAFRRLLVGNGYAKSGDTFLNNNRVRDVELMTDTGLWTRQELADSSNPAAVNLPTPGTYRWIKMTILSVYPGRRHDDTCLSLITPDFEYEDEAAR